MTSVLCIGPVYIDINLLNFPCEDGLPVEREISGGSYEVVPGGSAVNFALFGKNLGLQTILAGCVGDDSLGDMASSMFTALDQRTALRRRSDKLTEVGINYVAPNGLSVMTTAGEAGRSLLQRDVDSILEEFGPGVDYIYLGGTFKLAHLLPYLRSLTADSSLKSVCFILDHGRMPVNVDIEAVRSMRSLISAIDIYLPSRREFLDLWDCDSLESAAMDVLRSWKDRDAILAVKDGAAGALGFARGMSAKANAYEVQLRSSVGAGDSFNAGFVESWSTGHGLSESLDFACAFAAAKVAGSRQPSRGEALDLMAEGRRNG